MIKKFFWLLPIILSLILGNIALSQNFYGSIYINKATGIAGGSYDAPNTENAESIAYNSCVNKHKGNGKGCIYAGTVRNACAAVYWSSITKNAGWGWSSSLRGAEGHAKNACIDAGGKNCQNRLSFCTSRFY